jgi:hypothetical protein
MAMVKARMVKARMVKARMVQGAWGTSLLHECETCWHWEQVLLNVECSLKTSQFALKSQPG